MYYNYICKQTPKVTIHWRPASKPGKPPRQNQENIHRKPQYLHLHKVSHLNVLVIHHFVNNHYNHTTKNMCLDHFLTVKVGIKNGVLCTQQKRILKINIDDSLQLTVDYAQHMTKPWTLQMVRSCLTTISSSLFCANLVKYVPPFSLSLLTCYQLQLLLPCTHGNWLWMKTLLSQQNHMCVWVCVCVCVCMC